MMHEFWQFVRVSAPWTRHFWASGAAAIAPQGQGTRRTANVLNLSDLHRAADIYTVTASGRDYHGVDRHHIWTGMVEEH